MEKNFNILSSNMQTAHEKEDLQIIKDSDTLPCINLTFKSSRMSSKKCKKGVDSLLEKLENCNKKSCPIEIISLPAIINIEEKDGHNIQSMSPEYCKSRSPYHRDDDVVSPIFINDDSNDIKQRRKRKLGKPLKLSKDYKLHKGEEETIVKSNLSEKSNNFNYSQQNYSNENSLTTSIVQNKFTSDYNFKKFEKCLQMITLKKKNEYYCNDKFNDAFNTGNEQNSNYTLKKKNISRIRRRSECLFFKSSNENNRMRRKSCSDIKEPNRLDINISIPQNNVTFNEVESQLEKMFAGLIESDKDILKKNIQDSGKSYNFFSEDKQEKIINDEKTVNNTSFKEHLCLQKISCKTKHDKTKNISNTKNLKKKVLNCKDKSNYKNNSVNNISKHKKRQFENKQSLLKNNSLKKKINKYDISQETPGNDLVNNSSLKSKGPMIQIKNSEKGLNSAQIINIFRDDDEEKTKEKRKNNFNSINGRGKKLNFQNNFEFRGKSCNAGLFNSTLSNKYDAYTADITWVCVFCKKGPHFVIPGDSSKSYVNKSGTGTYTASAGVLSDLFGPYLIYKDFRDNIDNIEFSDKEETAKDRKIDIKNKRNLKSILTSDQYLTNMNKKKKKCSISEDSIYFGMNVLDANNQKWEIWLHEQCVMWAAGVYIAGGRINGLQDAVWDAAQSICDFCGLSGANIGCIKRRCKSVAHYCCALTTGWYFDVDQYIPKCNIHKIN